MALDASSKKCLDEVKRGKARRFAMIMKGEKILNLIVYKKGSVEKYKKQAKDEGGAGQFYHGVIDGKGANIAFNLCSADGFAEPPGKDMKLKAYLNEESGQKFKPEYRIVASLPDIMDGGDLDLDDAPAETQAQSGEDAAQTAKLIDALSKLTPLIKQAIAAEPERKAEILGPAGSIKQLIADGNHAQARQELLQYAAFLKEFSAAARQAGVDPAKLLEVWRTAKESVDGQLEKFRTALQNTGDGYLGKIAAGGIDSFVIGAGNEYVTLQTALFELQAAAGDARKQAGQKILTAVQSYKQFVAGNEFIGVCDANKLCGPMTVRQTLDDALAKLEQSIGALAA